jgi:hypothetical protein
LLRPLRRALRQCTGISRNRDGGGVFECDDRIGGYISLAAYFDPMVTAKRHLSSLFTADSIGDLVYYFRIR